MFDPNIFDSNSFDSGSPAPSSSYRGKYGRVQNKKKRRIRRSDYTESTDYEKAVMEAVALAEMPLRVLTSQYVSDDSDDDEIIFLSLTKAFH